MPTLTNKDSNMSGTKEVTVIVSATSEAFAMAKLTIPQPTTILHIDMEPSKDGKAPTSEELAQVAALFASAARDGSVVVTTQRMSISQLYFDPRYRK